MDIVGALFRFRAATFFIAHSCSIIRIALIYKDKEELDIILFWEIVLSILIFIVPLTYRFIKNKCLYTQVFFLNTFVFSLGMINIISLGSYEHSKQRDYYSICIFFAVCRSFSTLAYNLIKAIIIFKERKGL